MLAPIAGKLQRLFAKVAEDCQTNRKGKWQYTIVGANARRLIGPATSRYATPQETGKRSIALLV